MMKEPTIPLARFFRYSLLAIRHFAILVLAVTSAGCASTKPKALPPVASAFGPCERTNPDVALSEDTQYYSRADGRVHLSASVNSVAAFQLVLTAPDKAITGIELIADAFIATEEPSTAGTRASGLQPPPFPISMYRLWPITIERYPTWYLRGIGPQQRRQFLDALVPIDAPQHGQPFTISPRDRLAIWVETRIPKNALPGRYHTALTIRDGGGNLTRLPIDLWVRDLFLRPETFLPVIAGVQLAPVLGAHTQLDPNNLRAALADADARRVLTDAFQLLHDHGLSPFTNEVHTLLSQDIDGKVRVDWATYDAFCGPLIDGSAYDDHRPAAGWPLPVDLQQPDPIQYDGLQSPTYASVLSEYLAAVRAHFSDKGWLERSWVWFDLASEPQPTSDEIERFRRVASLMHLPSTMPTSGPAASPVPLVSTLIPQSMTPFGWVNYNFVDVAADVGIWATPARFQHRPTVDRRKAAGQRTWLPPDQPPYGGSLAVEAPPVHARSLPWQAFLQGSDALVLGEATHWPDKPFDQAIRDPAQPSNTWLLYPGDLFGLKEPIASLRLKQLQLGLQDCQLLRLLEEHGHGETARLLAGSLIKACGTEAYGDNFLDGLFGRRIDDSRVWQLAHELLLEEAAAAVTDPPGKLLDRAANRAAWARFLSATRRIEVTPESTRVVVSQRVADDAFAGRPHRVLTVTHDIAVRSELRTEIQGELKLGSLPPGGRSLKDLVAVGPLAEMGLARKRLAWELDGPLPCDLDGHYAQRIRFDAAAAGEVDVDAVLSIVQAPLASKPITVDGNLSDWLPHEYNAAGDFRLITHAASTGTSRSRTDELDSLPLTRGGSGRRSISAANRPGAMSQTIAYFCRDASTLYIALHAASPRTDADEGPPRKISGDIAYDGLFPIGEDLVEILIDPTNCGTLSDDVYHVVIKANGIAVFEKGIGMTPAIGKRQPWPGLPPQHAVVRTDFGWSAEIAIPLAAQGAPGKSTVWGLNIARLEPKRGEYSDWARAPRYCYDPRTLGNLLWPEL